MSAPAAAAAIQDRAPGFTPRVGLVLGSGLGALVDELADAVTIPYADIPGFRVGTVSGHAGRALARHARRRAGRLLPGPLARVRGDRGARGHDPIRTLRLLGAEILVLTNAAGSLRPEAGAGSLVALTDHINMQGFNPLVGPNDEEVGPRFPSLAEAYDPELRAGLHAVADELGTPLHDGVYLAVSGPSFETPGRDPRLPHPRRRPRRHVARCPRRSSRATAGCGSRRSASSPTSPRAWATSRSRTSRRSRRAAAAPRRSPRC